MLTFVVLYTVCQLDCVLIRVHGHIYIYIYMYSVAADASSFVQYVKSVQSSMLFECISSEEAGTKVGPDQLGPPVRVGSTRIVSDHEKNIKLKKAETFTHLKAKIPVNYGPN